MSGLYAVGVVVVCDWLKLVGCVCYCSRGCSCNCSCSCMRKHNKGVWKRLLYCLYDYTPSDVFVS